MPSAHWVLWGIALVATMALATVIASISELKHRHAFVSILYRFVPLLAASLGALAWAFSLFSRAEGVGIFRLVVAAIPVLGMVPIMVAPITNLPVLPLLVHSALAGVTLVLILRRNARWFAAHLEEV
jgi:hypothetical protein